MDSENDIFPIQKLRDLLATGESNESLVQQITDLFPVIIYVYDAEKKKMRFINRRVSELLGYAWEDLGDMHNDFSSLILEEDRELVRSELEKYLSLGDDNTHTYNCRYANKAGDCRYFKTVGTILSRNKSGGASSLLFIAQDITNNVQSELDKVAARKIIDNTESMLKIGLWNWDPVSERTEWSEGMYVLLGYTREELPEISPDLFYRHVNEGDRNKLHLKVKEALSTGNEYRMDFSIQTRDGRKLYINAMGRPVRDASGNIVKLTGIDMDISENYYQVLEYKANKELQKQTERMLNYGIFVWDVKDRSANLSDGLYEIFEVERDADKPGVNYDWYLQHVVEEDREKLESAVASAITNNGEFEVEYDIITERGNHKTVNSKGNVLVDDNNTPIRVVGNIRDVTRVKQVENELKRHVRELNRSNKELEEFAYAASHDLQEPLRKITTFGSRLMNKYGDKLGDEGRMYIERMETASESMRNLIENLLELSRVTRTAQQFESTNLNEVVDEAMSDLELPIDESGATISVDQLPQIEGIPSQLRQMFNNLLGNALKFRKPQVRPLIQVKATKLNRKEKEKHLLSTDRNYYQVDIADNGIGFDQEYDQRIFQIFQRLHGKSEYPGSGIGLAICKRIAERHSGQIFARGIDGDGAVFSVILPDKQ
ncbi:sensor histidine kinase [Flavihumibacter solisilvae]|uniref:sensor histidine kinase n=1 Tax=Flavihumibacter solisilvae TaxID=1349421 RepID=UPI00068E381E|nr:PAS domain-containing sensor histidine kinase [Flavihumibacter solisilvae]